MWLMSSEIKCKDTTRRPMKKEYEWSQVSSFKFKRNNQFLLASNGSVGGSEVIWKGDTAGSKYNDFINLIGQK